MNRLFAPKRIASWLPPALLLLALLVSVALSAPRANHDCAMYLQAANLLLEGKRPYVDFIDLNPPMIVYLSALPAAAARLTGVHAIKLFSLAVCLLAAASAWSAWSRLSRLESDGSLTAAGLVATAIAGLTVYLWWAGDFGQRDHLVLLLLLPYLCGRAVDTGAASLGRPGTTRAPHSAAVLRGIAAGTALCLKPPYLALVVAAELYLLLLRRDVRRLVAADTVAMVACGLVFLLHFVLLPEVVRQALLRWWPLLRDGYTVYEQPLAALWRPPIGPALGLGASALFLRFLWRGPLADVAALFGLATVVSTGLYFLQRKGWFYQTVPLLGFGAATLACLGAAAAATLRRRGVRFAPALAVVLAWVLVAASLDNAVQSDTAFVFGTTHNPFRGFVQHYSHEGDAVLVFNTSVTPAYPVIAEENRRPGSRYLWLFPVGMFYRGAAPPGPQGFAYHDDSNFPPEERRFLDDLKQDVASNPPALFLLPIGAGCQGCPTGFNLADYLRREGVLASLQGYRYVGESAGFAAFARPLAARATVDSNLGFLRKRRDATEG